MARIERSNEKYQRVPGQDWGRDESTCDKCGWQMQDHDGGFCPHKCLACSEISFLCKCEPY